YLAGSFLPTALVFSPGLVPWTVEAIDGDGFPVFPGASPTALGESARDGLKDVPSTSSQRSPYC
ncbi:hypothetical protein B0H65DRAFT_394803, partial [Neurospora tetraspora]